MGYTYSWAVDVLSWNILGIILGLYCREHPGVARAQVTFHRAAEKWDPWLFAINQCQHNLGDFTKLRCRRAKLAARARGKRAVSSLSAPVWLVFSLVQKCSNYICNLLISLFEEETNYKMDTLPGETKSALGTPGTSVLVSGSCRGWNVILPMRNLLFSLKWESF